MSEMAFLALLFVAHAATYLPVAVAGRLARSAAKSSAA